jgi:hypothetical protein
VSGSDSNVEVRVTATITELKSQLNAAQAEVKAFGGAIEQLGAAAARQNIANAIVPPQLQAALDQAKTKVADLTTQITAMGTAATAAGAAHARAWPPAVGLMNQMKAAAQSAAAETAKIEAAATEAAAGVDKIEPAAERAADGSSQLTREFIVIGHEALQGRFSRIPGSLMVMAEYSGGLTTALSLITPEIIAVGAAVLVVAAGFAEWAIQAYEAEKATKAAAVAGMVGGRPGARQQVEAGATQVQDSSLGTISQTQSVQLAAAINQLGELTDQQKAKVNQLAAAFLQMHNGDVAATEKFIAETFKSTSALDTFLKEHHLLSTDGITAWNSTTDAAKQFGIGIEAIGARILPAFKEWADGIKKVREELLITAASGGMAGAPASGSSSGAVRGNIPDASGTLINNTAATMGLSTQIANFATRIAEAESGGHQLGRNPEGDPNAISRSSTRALGMMQVEPDDRASGTTKTVGGQTYDLTDPVQNVKAGLAMLADLFQKFGGDQYKVAVGYNAGPGAAQRVGTPGYQLPPETQGYVRKVGVQPGGGDTAQGFKPFGDQAPGTTSDLSAERDQTKIDEYNKDNAELSKLTQDRKTIFDRQTADEADLARTLAMDAGAERDAAFARAKSRVEADQSALREIDAKRNEIRTPVDRDTTKQTERQITTSKDAIADTTPDRGSRAIADAKAEEDAWRQAAATVGITDGAKADFDDRAAKAHIAGIYAQSAADGTWIQQQMAGILKIEETAALAGGDRQQIELRVTEATKEYWAGIVQNDKLTAEQRRQAQEQLSRSTIRLAEEQATATKDASDKTFRATEAGYGAQLAAAHGNQAQIIEIENQKLAFVLQTHGAESAEYQTALAAQTNAVRTAVTEQVRVIEQAGKERIAAETATLKASAAANQISKLEEIQDLEKSVTNEAALENQALTTLISTLDEGTAAYKTAMDARTKLAETFATEILKLKTQEAQSAQQAADREVAIYVQAFHGITSAGESSVIGLIKGQETWLQAAQNVNSALLTGFVHIIGEMLGKWVVYELAKQTSDQATQDAIAVKQAAGDSGIATLLQKWLGLETAKLATTTTSTAAQTAVVTTGQTAQVTSVTAGQTGQTAAVAAGTAARTAATVSADAAGAAVRAATGSATVLGDAAKAYSGTYASVAQIPYVGPVLAPIAAAAAYAAVAAYETLASLDTGTLNVPSNMIAQLHAGEMVVPQTFASGIRSALGGTTNNSSGSSDTHLHYNPTVAAGSGADVGQQLAAHAAALKSWVGNISRNGNLTPPRYS